MEPSLPDLRDLLSCPSGDRQRHLLGTKPVAFLDLSSPQQGASWSLP